MALPRATINIFSIVIAFIIIGLVFYILQFEIDHSVGSLATTQATSTGMPEYKSILSLLLLVIILLTLLLLAMTCSSNSRIMTMLGASEQTVMPRNQIFFNLIQLSIDNLIDNNEESPVDPMYLANPPDYNSALIEAEPEETPLNRHASEMTEGGQVEIAELPPSYEVALSRTHKESGLRVTHSERCITYCVHK